MVDQTNSPLDRAKELWYSDKALEAGQIVFENIRAKDRPVWAANVLESVVLRTGMRVPPVEAILQIAKEPAKWPDAHRWFSAIRKSTLQLEQSKNRSPEKELDLAQLYLAENVAKVIYNATNPSDPFDEDSGWWIVACTKVVLDHVADQEFSTGMWAVLARERI